MTDILREDRAQGITILSLNRPEALNALSPALSKKQNPWAA
jgi:enoyl-CoA hydratase/carnithine racemase